jgi:ribosome-binding protein aMBF1 (putative translation factor)
MLQNADAMAKSKNRAQRPAVVRPYRISEVKPPEPRIRGLLDDVAPQLRELRVAAGLSQNQLAQRAQCDPRFVSWIERGMSASVEPAQKMAAALGHRLQLKLERVE